MDRRLSEGLRLAELGFAVHWLHPRSKTPIAGDWQRAPAAHAELLRAIWRPGMELGIHCGLVRDARMPVIVLDLDNPQSVGWARDRLPVSPLRARTRRGEHWYFRHPGIPISTRHRPDGLALDVQGEGAHVVAPPSIHITGHVYEWVDEGPTARVLAQLPTWSARWFPPPVCVMRMCSRGRGHVGARERARALGAVRKWRTFDESEGRGTQTYKLAQFLTLECRLSADEAFALLWTEWNPRLRQPYSEPTLRRKVDQALQSRLAASVAETPAGRLAAW